MAEGGMRKLLENGGIDDVVVFSSGTAAASGFPATAYALEAVHIWDADISAHKSQPLTPQLINEADLIIAMSPDHCYQIITMVPDAAGKTFLLKNYPEPGCDGEGIDDPIGGSLDIYNQTFIEIGEELGRILPHLAEIAAKKR
jgi:protein-tyrosine-phosphatase